MVDLECDVEIVVEGSTDTLGKLGGDLNVPMIMRGQGERYVPIKTVELRPSRQRRVQYGKPVAERRKVDEFAAAFEPHLACIQPDSSRVSVADWSVRGHCEGSPGDAQLDPLGLLIVQSHDNPVAGFGMAKGEKP